MEDEHVPRLQERNMSSTLEEQTKRLEENHITYRGSAKSDPKHLESHELAQRKERGRGVFHLDDKNVVRNAKNVGS